MKAAFLKTTALTNVSIRIPGTVSRTVRFELPVGCTISVAYEGEAENIGFKVRVQLMSKKGGCR